VLKLRGKRICLNTYSRKALWAKCVVQLAQNFQVALCN